MLYLRRFVPLLLAACLIFTVLCPQVMASGGAGQEKPDAKKAEGGGKAGGGHGSAESTPPKVPKASDGYVHHWIKMPSFNAASVLGLGSVDVRPTRGKVLIIFFLASWCELCQEIIGPMRTLEQRYQGLAADFVYMFAHDTKDDAAGFMREHRMTSGLLANHDVLKEYHNPELPTVYIGDRDGWLLTRYLKVKPDDLAEMDQMLRRLTAY